MSMSPAAKSLQVEFSECINAQMYCLYIIDKNLYRDVVVCPGFQRTATANIR